MRSGDRCLTCGRFRWEHKPPAPNQKQRVQCTQFRPRVIVANVRTPNKYFYGK